MSEPYQKITASVVTYKTDPCELEKLLQSICQSAAQRIYLVDNSPTDSLRSFENYSPKVQYIFGHGNIGYGAAQNIAIKLSIESSAKYHIVLNPDIYFDPTSIEVIANYMEHKPSVGLVMPKVLYPNGELQYLCKLLPTPMDLIGRRFIPLRKWVANQNYRFEMRQSGYNKEMLVPFLSGCFMFLRNQAISKSGAFDDLYFMYCEDIDLCRRISASGYKTIYYPNVSIIHAHKKESFKSKTMLKIHIQSAFRYFNKWGWFYDKYRRQINQLATRFED